MAGNQTSEQGYKISITRAEIGDKEQVKSNIQTTLNSFNLSVGVNIHLSQDVNRESLLKELHTKVKGLSVNLTANTKLLIQQVDSAMGSLKHRYADSTYALKIKADTKTIESQVSAAVNAGIKTGFTTVKPEDTRLPIAATVMQPAISTAELTAVVNEVAKLQKVTSAAPSEIRLSDGSLKTVEKNLTDVIVTLELLYDLIESKSASTEILDSTKFNAMLDNLSKQNHLYEQQEKLLDSLKRKHIENVKAQATLTPGTAEYAVAEKETAASRSAYILAANKLGLDVETKKIKFELLSIDEKAAQKSAQRTQQLQKEKENQKELNQLIKQYRSEQNKLLSLTGKNDSQEYKQVQANVAKAKAEINKYMNDANNKVSTAQKTSTNQTLNDIDAQFNSDKLERERRNLDSLIEKAKAYRMSIEKLNSMERKTRGMTIYDDQIKNSQEYPKFTAEINTATQALQQMNAVREKIKQHGGLATQQEYQELARLSQTYEDAKLNAEQYFAVWQNRNADFLSDFKEQDKLAKIGSNLSRYMGEYEAKLRKIPALYKRIISLQESLNNGSITSNRAATELNNIQTEARAAGVEVTTLWDRMKKSFKGNFRGAIANMGWMLLYSTVRQLTQNVIQLDTAMTELKKVTNETEKTYTQFLGNAETRAKSLGATLVDTVSATSDFARLGYGIKQAETLADSALIYANVGDGVDSIDTASSTLISTMQGFGIEADNVMTIVDKFNEVANKYAASAADIGEITKRAASAMSVAGNSLDQTIALGVAANTTVQDADTVGTALRTMSARIRGAKSDLESWGEDTSDLADSTSKLRNEIKALSGVDIMLDEQTFKSSYDILIEIGKQWDNLTDVSRSNIAQLMFGKQQLNVGLSILQDVELAEQILKTSEDSFGSATKENEIYLDSIQGRISQTAASWQSLSNNILDDDVVKQAVTGFNTILSIVNELLDKAGLLPTVLAGMGTVWAQHNRVGECALLLKVA